MDLRKVVPLWKNLEEGLHQRGMGKKDWVFRSEYGCRVHNTENDVQSIRFEKKEKNGNDN